MSVFSITLHNDVTCYITNCRKEVVGNSYLFYRSGELVALFNSNDVKEVQENETSSELLKALRRETS